MMVCKEKKKKKKNFFFFFVFSHPGGSVSLPGVRESGRISGRLPDDPGGFTCMSNYPYVNQCLQLLKMSKALLNKLGVRKNAFVGSVNM